MKNRLWILVLLLAALPSQAWAGRPVDETRKAAADGSVNIELITGRLRVEGWNRNEVRVKGTLGDEIEELEFDSGGRHTSIEFSPRGRNVRGGGTDVTVSVPAGSELSLEVVTGDITVEGVRGRVAIESATGSIRIRGSFQEVEVESVSGNVEVITDGALRRASIEAVSGTIRLEGGLAADGRVSVETVSGRITASLPENAPARYEISTFSGDIRNDFGPRPEKAGEFLPSKTLEFTVGAGSAKVSISAFSGVVELRRR